MTAPRPRGGRAVGPLGLYHPGRSWLHRLGPGASMGALAGLSVAVIWLRGPVSAAALLVGVVVGAATAVPVRATVRGLTGVLVTAVVVGAYQWWQRGWATGVEVAADLVTLVAAATAVTATTQADRMLDALTHALRPLRRLGVSPQTVALAVGLMLRAVPALARTAGEVRDAARARGLDRDPRALLVPAALRAVGRARATGDALAARGLGD